MAQRGNYHTKQYQTILEYMETIPGEHVTVGDLHERLLAKGSAIGTTTIYRQLERMVDNGLVKKYTIMTGLPACYEFIGSMPEDEENPWFHCCCESCGKLIHLHCGELTELGIHLKNLHRFSGDPKRTVFYGLCEDCMKKKEKEENKEWLY